MNIERRYEEYIEVDGLPVNKGVYEDCKKLNLHCPYCKSNENKLRIEKGYPDVVFIECSRCGHSLTYGMLQKPFAFKNTGSLMSNRIEIKKRLDRLEKLIGKNTDEKTKLLFEIVTKFNKEWQELLENPEQESRKLQNEIENTSTGVEEELNKDNVAAITHLEDKIYRLKCLIDLIKKGEIVAVYEGDKDKPYDFKKSTLKTKNEDADKMAKGHYELNDLL